MSEFSKDIIDFCDELIKKHHSTKYFISQSIEHSLITIQYLKEDVIIGDWDVKDTQIPFYEKCTEYLTEQLNNRKKRP